MGEEVNGDGWKAFPPWPRDLEEVGLHLAPYKRSAMRGSDVREKQFMIIHENLCFYIILTISKIHAIFGFQQKKSKKIAFSTKGKTRVISLYDVLHAYTILIWRQIIRHKRSNFHLRHLAVALAFLPVSPRFRNTQNPKDLTPIIYPSLSFRSLLQNKMFAWQGQTVI